MARSTVAVKFTGDVSDLKRETGKAEGVLSGFGKKAAGILKTGLLAAGAVGAAAFIKGFSDAIDNEKALDKTAASFGLDPKTAAKLGKIAGDLYSEAYGESLGQVSDAVANVQRSLGELDDAQVKDLAANALDFAAAFDVEVAEAIGAASFLLKNNLVDDGEEAFDILTTAMQRLPPLVRDELLEATQEYATFFDDLGISGTEAFALITRAANKGGKFGVDKVGDALKELTIRATDGSKASAEAYAMIGASADEMAARFVAGGDTARGALDDLISGLLAMENPVDQANAAIGLFGTPLEDLSVTEIPQFLQQLQNMKGGLGDVEGAADDMGNTLNDNVATKLEAFKRESLMKLSNFISEKVIPALESLGDTYNEKIKPFVKDAVRRFKDDLLPVLTEVYETFKDSLTPVMSELARVWEEELGPALKDFWSMIEEDLGPALEEFVTLVDGPVAYAIGSLASQFVVVIEQMANFLRAVTFMVDTQKVASEKLAQAVVIAMQGIAPIAETVMNLFAVAWKVVSFFVALLIGLVRNLLQNLLRAFGDPFEAFRQKGMRLVKGLIRGIADMKPSLSSVAKGLASTIGGFFPGSPVKEGPLTSWNNGGAGKRLGQMLAEGLSASKGVLSTAADSLAGSVQLGSAGTPQLALAGVGGSAIGRGAASGVTNVYHINASSISDREVARMVRDAIESARRSGV